MFPLQETTATENVRVWCEEAALECHLNRFGWPRGDRPLCRRHAGQWSARACACTCVFAGDIGCPGAASWPRCCVLVIEGNIFFSTVGKVAQWRCVRCRRTTVCGYELVRLRKPLPDCWSIGRRSSRRSVASACFAAICSALSRIIFQAVLCL